LLIRSPGKSTFSREYSNAPRASKVSPHLIAERLAREPSLTPNFCKFLSLAQQRLQSVIFVLYAVSAWRSSSLKFEYPPWIRFDCQRCATCCGNTEKRIRRILLTNLDVKRIIEATGFKPQDFTYPRKGKPPFIHELIKVDGRCLFLEDNHCRIYKHRPLICRCFPFWIEQDHGERFRFKASLDCPGVGKGKRLDRPFFSKLLKTALSHRVK